MENLIEAIKEISIRAGESTEPMGLLYGKVIKESPLEILCGQRLILNEDRLILSIWVRRTEFKCAVQWQSETSSDHRHSISGEKTIILDNSLKTGDNVVMLKLQGGQKFYVLEKEAE
jgi:hypothetical protein